MGRERTRKREHFFLHTTCIITFLLTITACAFIPEQPPETDPFEQANALLKQGYYEDSIKEYKSVLTNYPDTLGDQALYRIGIIYANPDNNGRDVRIALKNFESILIYYPKSRLREEARVWILLLLDMDVNRKKIHTLQAEISRLKKMEVNKRKLQKLEAEISRLEKELGNKKERIEFLEERITSLETQLEDLKKIDLDIEEKKRKEIP